jgi:transcriptional regulator with XRE-family HTH domain
MRTEVVNNVRGKAREAGISLLEISRATGVSYSMLRRIAAGKGNVCLGDAVAVSAVLGMPVDRLFVLESDRLTDVASRADLQRQQPAARAGLGMCGG